MDDVMGCWPRNMVFGNTCSSNSTGISDIFSALLISSYRFSAACPRHITFEIIESVIYKLDEDLLGAQIT